MIMSTNQLASANSTSPKSRIISLRPPEQLQCQSGQGPDVAAG
jgi:hypothetical protein